MSELSTHLRAHQQLRDARCILCGVVQRQFYVGVVLDEGGQAVGDLCPRCLSEPPGRRARTVWARASRLWAEVGEALSLDAAPREGNGPPQQPIQADRRQCERERRRRAKDRARREAERRRRMAWPGPEAPDPEPVTADEKAGLAELLVSLVQGLEGLRQWPLSLADLMAAESCAVRLHCPGLPEEEVSRCVESRYRDYIAPTV